MIEVRNISKEWEDFSIQNLSLEVQDQEYFVILGPTGAGKTLLLELIAGFHEPDAGEIRIGGAEVTNLNPEDRSVGFVYQDYSLFPHLNVEENIKFGLSVDDFSQEEIRKRTQEIMRVLDIQHLTGRYPATLSGGQRQKVALARGLILDPKILLLDEPISALDVPSQERVRRELKRVHCEMEVTTIHVTHNREEASWLGDRIAVMGGGEIVQVGTSDEIFRRPKSEFVASFVGTENIFSGRSEVEGGIANIDIGEGVQLEAVSEREGEVKACIRPEEIIVSKQPVQSSGRNMFEGEIVGVTKRESTVRLRIDAGQEFSVIITKRSLSDMGLEIGEKVYLAFKASSVHVI